MEPAEYIEELNAQLTYLFAFSRTINELDFAAALFGEFRGAQDAGWSTTETAYQVFAELRALGARPHPLELAEYRQLLCLYAQLSEAGGVYEGLLNMMGVVQLKPYNLWPFQDMVRVHSARRKVIGPNANAMFRRLAEAASAIGMMRLSDLLALTFNDDVRNGLFHADYIIKIDGLRLRHRNGGNAYVISHDELGKLITIGVAFFDLYAQMQRAAVESFRPAKRIVGRFSLNPPMAHTVEFNADSSFSISSNSIGYEPDAQFERQQRINTYLGGRVFGLYSDKEDELVCGQEAMRRHGFEATTAVLDPAQLEDLLRDVQEHGLWAASNVGEAANLVLLVSPSGFERWGGEGSLARALPAIEKVEFG